MKASELMQFDWVCLENDPTPRQVDWIRSGEVGLFWNRIVTPPYLEPIPLTEEILEKNGFEKQWQDNLVYENEDESLSITFHPKNINYTNGMYDYIDIERGCMTINEMPIEYVHQLQHALRLCGIDKELKL